MIDIDRHFYIHLGKGGGQAKDYVVYALEHVNNYGWPLH